MFLNFAIRVCQTKLRGYKPTKGSPVINSILCRNPTRLYVWTNAKRTDGCLFLQYFGQPAHRTPHNRKSKNQWLYVECCIASRNTGFYFYCCVGKQKMYQKYAHMFFTFKNPADRQINVTKCMILHHLLKLLELAYSVYLGGCKEKIWCDCPRLVCSSPPGGGTINWWKGTNFLSAAHFFLNFQ